jgi:MFS family permease
MLSPGNGGTTRGQWLALTAALLGWMFDGFEMGLFPVVARPALKELIGLGGGVADDDAISFWFALATASFLVGAATGGVLFGWLGDRLGRVRAMSLSILTYALCSGLGGVATAPWQMVGIRFLAALGMGGEWSLGVALVMEVWGGRSRALLAGLIGAAANVGYMLVALLSVSLGSFRSTLYSWGMAQSWVEWRLLMVCAALPALLTFFIRLWVPESQSWERERRRGATSSWATRDLLAVLAGVGVCAGLLAVWVNVDGLGLRIGAMAFALVLVACCYLYPIFCYLTRSGEPAETRRSILSSMLLAALISGVPLLATWGAVQWAPAWAHKLGEDRVKEALSTRSIKSLSPEIERADQEILVRRWENEVRYWKEYTQLASAVGAIIGSLGGALLAGWIGRRIAYVFLCVSSLGAVLLFYQGNTTVDAAFLLTALLMGGLSAAFYGWLPLYLPELFPTRVRATGQGFGFNFGRIIAAVGVLQVPVLMGKPPDYARACSLLASIYVAGLVVIWLAPETRGRPLPE